MKKLKWLAVMVALVAVACTSTGGTSSQDINDNEPIVSTPVFDQSAGTSIHCGYERWNVKTGTDPLAGQVSMFPKQTTVSALVSMPQPTAVKTGQKAKYPPQLKRLPQEMQVYTVSATITQYNVEQDNDIHLVLTSAGKTMIAEIPNPACVKGGPFLTGITNSRALFARQVGGKLPAAPPSGKYSPPPIKVNLSATVTGVAFFDFIHGQAGVAPNGVELHPVINLAFP